MGSDQATTLKHRVYRRLVGETVGPGAQQFLRDLSLVTGSFAIAKVISGVVNIFAGRLLGPQEYGAVNVLVSAGATIAPFMMLGLQYSVVKYGADPEARSRVFGSALFVSALASLLVCFFAFVFRVKLAEVFHIDPRLLFFSLAYAATTAAYMMMSGMQQALGPFTSRGLN
jgi:O-antigen/teichoic acid export membrane protein